MLCFTPIFRKSIFIFTPTVSNYMTSYDLTKSLRKKRMLRIYELKYALVICIAVIYHNYYYDSKIGRDDTYQGSPLISNSITQTNKEKKKLQYIHTNARFQERSQALK